MNRCHRKALCGMLAVLGLGAPAAGADAAAESRLLAPLLDEYTLAVAHVPLRELPVAPVAHWLGLDAQAGPARLGAIATQFVDHLLQSGIEELYVVVDPRDWHQGWPRLVLPATPKAERLPPLAQQFPQLQVAQARLGEAVVISSPEGLERARRLRPAARPELLAALQAGGSGGPRLAVAPTALLRRAVAEILPRLPDAATGLSTNDLLKSVSWVSLGVRHAPAPAVRLTVASPSPQAAQELHAALGRLADAAHEAIKPGPAQQSLATMRKVLLVPPEGAQMKVLLEGADPRLAELADALWGTAADREERAQFAAASKQLHELGIAMHNYLDAHQTFPPAYRAAGEKRLLSWRVLLLPSLGEEALFRQFKLNEPWDSRHNRALVAKMPAIFARPGSAVAADGRTVYLAPRGPRTMFAGPEGVPIQACTDGTSNTIVLVEVDDEHGQIWTSPEDWEVDAEQSSAKLRGQGQMRGTLLLFGDASVRRWPAQGPAAALRAALTRDGREVFEFPGE